MTSVALPDAPLGSTHATVVCVLMGGPCSPFSPFSDCRHWPGEPTKPASTARS